MTEDDDFELDEKQDDMAEGLLDVVCTEVHRIMKQQPGVFAGSDGYDDLILRLAAKLEEYARLSGEGYQGPDFPPDFQFIILHGVPGSDDPDVVGPFDTVAGARAWHDKEVSPLDTRSWWVAPMRLP